jgi:hypothetical protein
MASPKTTRKTPRPGHAADADSSLGSLSTLSLYDADDDVEEEGPQRGAPARRLGFGGGRPGAIFAPGDAEAGVAAPPPRRISAHIRPESAAEARGATSLDLFLPPTALATHCYLDTELKEGAVKRPLAKGFLKPLEARLQAAYSRVAAQLEAAGMFCPVGTFKHNSCRRLLRGLLPPGACMPPAGTICCTSFRLQARGVLLGHPGAPTTARYNRKNLPGLVDFLKALCPLEGPGCQPPVVDGAAPAPAPAAGPLMQVGFPDEEDHLALDGLLGNRLNPLPWDMLSLFPEDSQFLFPDEPEPMYPGLPAAVPQAPWAPLTAAGVGRPGVVFPVML